MDENDKGERMVMHDEPETSRLWVWLVLASLALAVTAYAVFKADSKHGQAVVPISTEKLLGQSESIALAGTKEAVSRSTIIKQNKTNTNLHSKPTNIEHEKGRTSNPMPSELGAYFNIAAADLAQATQQLDYLVELNAEHAKLWQESSNKLDVEQLLDMMNRAREGDINALYKLNRMAALCDYRRKKLLSLCEDLREAEFDRYEAGYNFNLIDKIDEQAMAGNLYAQYVYYQALKDGLKNMEMNPLRDGQLWLQRRHRLVLYTSKFARAGSVNAIKNLANFYDTSEMIRPNLFWAAVFYSQWAKSDPNVNFVLDNLIEINNFDEFDIERERQRFFD